ncbi:MAG: beta-hydroxyacyl-ACP dehydratase [Planctomycetes bacterium]|nr:beta-hydroxyacyl-ACP dehydratase [Planctomycetota bacterium]
MVSDQRAEIEARIPHRDPFLFVDRILEQTEDSIITEWTVSPELDVFRGHYPGQPLLPGVLSAEFCFQSAALLFSDPGADTPQSGVPVLTKIEDARYKRMVRPGETLTARLELTEKLGPARYMRGQVRCGDELVLRLSFVVALTEVQGA